MFETLWELFIKFVLMRLKSGEWKVREGDKKLGGIEKISRIFETWKSYE